MQFLPCVLLQLGSHTEDPVLFRAVTQLACVRLSRQTVPLLVLIDQVMCRRWRNLSAFMRVSATFRLNSTSEMWTQAVKISFPRAWPCSLSGPRQPSCTKWPTLLRTFSSLDP